MSFGYQILGFGGFPNREGALFIEGSGSFNGTDGKLTRTISDAGNRRTFILEVIFKRGSNQSSFITAYSSGSDTFYFYLSGGQVYVQNYISANQIELKSDAVLKDFGAWYHLIVAVDTTQSTDTNRVKGWVNGVELTWVSSPRTYPTQNYETKFNTGSQEHQIGHSSTTYSSDYFARAASYDGLTMTDPVTDEFGEYDGNGVWVPLDVSGKAFGTTGFLIEGGTAFTNGTDSSGNSQNFTKGGTITVVKDTLTDKAAELYGNYATINLNDMLGGNTPVISNGLSTFTRNGTGSDNQQAYGTQVAQGKKYWEFLVSGNSNSIEIGWAAQGNVNGNSGTGPTNYDAEVYLLQSNAAGGSAPWDLNMIEGTAGSAGSTTTSLDSGEITTTPRLKFAIDTDAKKYYLGVVHGTYGGWLNTSGTGGQSFDDTAPTGTWSSDERFLPYVFAHAQTGAGTFYFRDADWTDSAPTGFTALNTAHLPAPTVSDPSAYFQIATWTGDGTAIASGGKTITFGGNSNLSPDFVWVKRRNENRSHQLYDSVRGWTKTIYSDLTDAEGTVAEGVSAVTSDGFTVGDNGGVNESSDTYVAWCWKAGGAPTADNTGSASPTSGSIMIDGSASTSTLTTSNLYPKRASGSNVFKFGMIRYTGNGSGSTQTLANPFSWAPDVIFCKNMEGTDDWETFHSVLGSGGTSRMYLNKTDGADADSRINAVSANQITFVASTSGCNPSSQDVMMYAWGKTPGAIGMGKYKGNGNADGPNIVIDDGASGFRPAYIMFKNVSQDGYGWSVFDVARDNKGNPNSTALATNNVTTDSTVASYKHDITANGFKIRGNSGETNYDGNTIVYMAFAENPFGGSGVAQAKGRGPSP